VADYLSRLSVRGLGVHYGRRCAVRNVSLEFSGPGITALVGPSGAGKSSLLLACAGLMGDVPGARVDGEVDPGDSGVGIVFQQPLAFPLSIAMNVGLALRERGRSATDVDARVALALQQAGLWTEVKDRLRESATRLSGGQLQRLCIARSLALAPSFLLLDEPCSSLDPMSAKVVENTLRELSGSIHIVIVTHNLAQARRLSNRMIVLWDTDGGGSQVLADGPTETMFREPPHELVKLYLDGQLG